MLQFLVKRPTIIVICPLKSYIVDEQSGASMNSAFLLEMKFEGETLNTELWNSASGLKIWIMVAVL